jgi:hypothetical protein
MCAKILGIEKSRYFNVDNLKNPCIIVISLCGVKLFFWFSPAYCDQVFCGNSSVGRAQPCQGWGREFESRFPLQCFIYVDFFI